jgi:hypothetical protein
MKNLLARPEATQVLRQVNRHQPVKHSGLPLGGVVAEHPHEVFLPQGAASSCQEVSSVIR